TAGRAAKPLTGTASGRREVLLAAGPIAARKIGWVAWALTLAWRRRTGAGPVRRRGWRLLGLGGHRLTPLCAATAIPSALGLTLLPTLGSLAILPAGVSSSPSPCRGPALGATVSGLGMGGLEAFLAPLEETPSLSRATSPLTGVRIAASWMW